MFINTKIKLGWCNDNGGNIACFKCYCNGGTVTSAIIAVRARNEAKSILVKIKSINYGDKNVSTTGDINIKNQGFNNGMIVGMNTGEVHTNGKRQQK